MGGESVHHAYVGCLSMERHLHATEYEEIVSFAKRNGFYYAVKAEDTNCISEMGWITNLEETAGKVHCHWVQIREFATYSHDTKDRRYGAIRKSHLREDFMKQCPAIAAAISKSQFAQKFALMFAQMTSDHAVAYLNKESLLKCHNLPADLVVLRPYISLKEERKYNPEDDAHEKAYEKLGYCIPATFESVWSYLNYRMYEQNDCKRIKREHDLISFTDNLLAAINKTSRPIPKSRKTSHADSCGVRYCPRCIDEDRTNGCPAVLGYREQFCPMHKKS